MFASTILVSGMSKSIKFNVYGKIVSVQKSDNGWKVFFLGNEGKRRPANELFIPSFISEEELEGYFSDLCHEWASDRNSDVFRLS